MNARIEPLRVGRADLANALRILSADKNFGLTVQAVSGRARHLAQGAPRP